MPAPTAASVGDITTLDRTMRADDAQVHDTLCLLQAPSGVTRVADMMTAAGLRTERGSGFNPVEVRGVVDRLLASGHATRDTQGRVRAAAPHASARFRALMLDAPSASRWFDAWRKLVNFEQA